MRQLLNTLFVLSEDAYLSLDGETVAVSRTGQPTRQFPLHTLEGTHQVLGTDEEIARWAGK